LHACVDIWLYLFINIYIAIHGVRFNQLAYTVNEDSQLAQLMLVLDNPPLSDITVQLSTTDRSAIGEYMYKLADYVVKCHM